MCTSHFVARLRRLGCVRRIRVPGRIHAGSPPFSHGILVSKLFSPCREGELQVALAVSFSYFALDNRDGRLVTKTVRFQI